jgi:hypothetical protein
MSGRPCFLKCNIEGISDVFDSKVNDGMSEQQAAMETVLEHYENIKTRMIDLNKTINPSYDSEKDYPKILPPSVEQTLADTSAPKEAESVSLQSSVDHQVEQQPVNTEPTEGQKKAGNYKQGHVTVHGMDISVENPKGSTRSGVDENGDAWENEMEGHYGNFRGTIGKDGDAIDTFVGDNPHSQKVFVIDQVNPETGEFDESKVMVGYNSVEEAKAAYDAHYDPDWKGFSAITEVGVEKFKKWLYDGHKQTKPFNEYYETPAPAKVGLQVGDKVITSFAGRKYEGIVTKSPDADGRMKVMTAENGELPVRLQNTKRIGEKETEDVREIPLSQAMHNSTLGRKAESLQKRVDRFMKTAVNAFPTKVVQRMSDLPQSVKDDPMFKTSLIDAVYDPVTGTVYIVAEHMDPSKLSTKWVHEQGVHRGLRVLFKDNATLNKILGKVFNQIGMDRIMKVVPSEYIDQYREGAMTKEDLAEEYMAYMAERIIKGEELRPREQNLWNKITDIIRDFHRKNYETDDLTDKDIADMIHASTRALYDSSMVDTTSKGQTVFTAPKLSIHNHEKLRQESIDAMRLSGIPEERISEIIANADMMYNIAMSTGYKFQRGSQMDKNRAMRSNSDDLYQVSMDFAADCIKRIDFKRTLDMYRTVIKETFGRSATDSDIMTLMLQMKANGETTPCLYCYVESPRRAQEEMASRWRDSIFGETIPQLLKDDKGGHKKSALEQLRDQAQKGVFTPEDIDPDALIENKNVKDIRFSEPIRYKGKSYDNLHSMMTILTTSQAKKAMPYEEYGGEILKFNKRKAAGTDISMKDYLNNSAGLRFFSSSDFVPEHIVDIIQAITHMQAVGVGGHNYTKVEDFVKIFGDTGMKVNLSLYMKPGEEFSSNPQGDKHQSFDFEKAKYYRSIYKHVGTELMAVTHEQIEWALNQDWIDFIIPFHSSSFRYTKQMNWQDFSNFQKEKWIQKKHEIKPEWVEKGWVDSKGKITIRQKHYGGTAGIDSKTARENYLAICKEMNVKPVFADVKLANGKSVTEHPGYIKLKKDYARIDSPLAPPDATKINMEEAGRVIREFADGMQDKKETLLQSKSLNDVIEILNANKGESLSKEQIAEQFQKNETSGQNYQQRQEKVRKSIIGPKGAKNLEGLLDNLDKAKEMEKQGSESNTIFYATGWEKFPDGWRYDLPENMTVNPKQLNKKVSFLANVVEYHDLYKAYPILQYAKVRVDPNIDAEAQITFHPILPPVITVKDTKSPSLESNLIHEIQHAIQQEEGFSRGGNHEIAIQHIKQQVLREIKSDPIFNQVLNLGFSKTEPDNIRIAAQKKVDQYLNQRLMEMMNASSTSEAIHEAYKRIAGEVEARNAEVRRTYLTPEYRKKFLISQTQSVAEDQKIYIDNSIRLRNAPKMSVKTNTDEKPSEISVYHGGTVSSISSATLDNPLFVSEDESQANEYAKGNGGKVESFKINNNAIADEDFVRSQIKDLGLNSKDENWDADELNLYELIDKYYDTSLPEKDIEKLFKNLEKQGFGGARFYDTNLKTLKQDIENIAIFNPELVSGKPKFSTVTVDTKERDELVEKAKEHFGTTTNFKEAGYILPDGSMLDFSGKRIGGSAGRRDMDHREINEIGTEMTPFMEMGNIRLHTESNGIELASKPTKEQLRTIADFARDRNGKVWVDFLKRVDENTIMADHAVGYESASPAKVVNDINKYYDDGIKPLTNIRFSIIDGKKRSTVNSEGQPIHETEEGIKNFWKWFGDSKVVDSEGRPLVVYHGTDTDFDQFIPKGRTASFFGKDSKGIYFTDSYNEALGHANGSITTRSNFVRPSGEPKVIPAYLKADYIHDVRDWREPKIIGDNSKGKLGATLHRPFGYSGNHYFVTNPSQIKSTDNSGEFSPKTGNIRFSVKSNNQVKDETVYRGVGERINVTYGNVSDDGMGEFYTNNPTMAAWFAGTTEYDPWKNKYVNTKKKGTVTESKLTLNNPYVIDETHPEYYLDNEVDSFQLYMDEIEAAGGVEAYRNNLIKQGYDGIVLKDNTTNFYDDGTYDILIKFKPEDKVRFSSVKPLDQKLREAKENYSERVRTKRTIQQVLGGVRELYQDNNMPIRRLEEEIKKLGGRIADNMKPYRDMFNSFGRTEQLYKAFTKDKMKPVLRAINDIVQSGVDRDVILPYLIAKHSLERNAYMRDQEAKIWASKQQQKIESENADFESTKKRLQKSFDKWMAENPSATKEEIDQKKADIRKKTASAVVEHDKWVKRNPPKTQDEIDAYKETLKTKDYSGIRPLSNDEYENPDDLAREIVDSFEKMVPPHKLLMLHSKLKNATDEVVDTWLRGKTISEEQANDMKSRFKNFIPLQGWREGAAKDNIYQKGSGFNKSLTHAKGRSSLADNPLAYLQKTAFLAIGEQTDNEVKQSMLNLIKHNMGDQFSHLYKIKKAYYVQDVMDDGTPGWRLYLDENGELARPPEEMFESGEAVSKIYDQYQKLRKPSQAREHEVVVKTPTGDVVLVFPDKYLSVAQAMNRKNYMYHSIFGNVVDAKDWNGQIVSTIGGINNFIKANLTSRDITFPLRNIFRDLPEAALSQYIQGDSASKVVAGVPSAMAAITRQMSGKADMNNPTDKLYQEFLMSGGTTGFTHLKDAETIEKEINKEIKRLSRSGNMWDAVRRSFINVEHGIEAWNEVFENATRFSVYMASRKAGKTVGDSAADAKEASVNFNRKGKMTKSLDSLWAFFNVSVQSLQKNLSLAKRYPKRFAMVAGSFMMYGFIEAMMMSKLHHDDDDNYYDLNEYVRQNYMVLPWFSKEYLRIPLPQFWRGFKALGTLAYDVSQGKVNVADASTNALRNFTASLSPIDVGGFYRDGEWSLAPIIPTIAKPTYDINVNKDFMGNSIHKSPFTKEQEMKLAESGLGKNNVNPAVKFFTDALAAMGGKDNETKFYRKDGETKKIPGLTDWNPSDIEYQIKGYLGGTYKFLSDVITTTVQVVNPDKEVDFNNIPFVNVFIRKTPASKWKVIEEYYNLKKDIGYSSFDMLKKTYLSDAKKDNDTSKYEDVASDPYLNEYSKIMEGYDNRLTKQMQDMDYKTAEGSQEVVETMKEAISEIKSLKQNYKKP